MCAKKVAKKKKKSESPSINQRPTLKRANKAKPGAKKSTRLKTTSPKEDKQSIAAQMSRHVDDLIAKSRAEDATKVILTEQPAPTVEEIHPQKLALKMGRIHGNEAKKKIAIDMLERYTGHNVTDFEQQIILTNFHYYTQRFNALLDDVYYTEGSAFKASTSKKAKVTIVEFGVGSAMAALIGELLAVIEPKAVLFLGLCGAVHSSLKVGDFILPIASIRAEGVSRHFLPLQVPALPTFKIQKFVSQILVEHNLEYRTGTIHSTDYRFWEFDDTFKNNLIDERVLAVEMETAALFTTCFVSKVNIGALLLVSDCPMKFEGIKTKDSAKMVFRKYTDIHIEIGIEAMAEIAERGEKIRHYTW